MLNLQRLASADISENELTGSLAPLSGIGTLRECLVGDLTLELLLLFLLSFVVQ